MWFEIFFYMNYNISPNLVIFCVSHLYICIYHMHITCIFLTHLTVYVFMTFHHRRSSRRLWRCGLFSYTATTLLSHLMMLSTYSNVYNGQKYIKFFQGIKVSRLHMIIMPITSFNLWYPHKWHYVASSVKPSRHVGLQ